MLSFWTILATSAAAYKLYPSLSCVQRSPTIVLSPPSVDAAIVCQAATAWNTAMGRERLACSSAGPGVIYRGGPPGGDTIQRAYLTEVGLIDAGAVVRLGAGLKGDCLFNVALHELGHTLGLLHSDVPGAIMSYILVVDADGTPLPCQRALLSSDDVLGGVATMR